MRVLADAGISSLVSAPPTLEDLFPAVLPGRGMTGSMAGTAGLVRLYLRKDRIVAPLWILVIGLVPLLYAVSFEGLYPAAQQRLSFYEATLRTPATLALVGPIFGSDLGALVTWRRGGLLLTVQETCKNVS